MVFVIFVHVERTYVTLMYISHDFIERVAGHVFVFAEATAMPLHVVWFLHIACSYGTPAVQISTGFMYHEPATGGKDWWSNFWHLVHKWD